LLVSRNVSKSALTQRLNHRFREDGRAARSDWSGDVTVGVAVGAPAERDFASLLHQADEDMYERRRPS